jgi:hypothetical protein
MAAIVFATICAFLAPSADSFANGDDGFCFQYNLVVYPRLQVSSWQGNPQCADWWWARYLKVDTNHCTLVTWKHENFTRAERSCDGNTIYETTDVINGYPVVWFWDQNPNCGGHGLVPHYSGNSATVESHNGGYWIGAYLWPDWNQYNDLCKDAGCYEGKICLNVSLLPFDEFRCCE